MRRNPTPVHRPPAPHSAAAQAARRDAEARGGPCPRAAWGWRRPTPAAAARAGECQLCRCLPRACPCAAALIRAHTSSLPRRRLPLLPRPPPPSASARTSSPACWTRSSASTLWVPGTSSAPPPPPQPAAAPWRMRCTVAATPARWGVWGEGTRRCMRPGSRARHTAPWELPADDRPAGPPASDRRR